MRILLVEDEEHIAKALLVNFKAQGYEVEWVATGEDALAVWQSRACHLIVLDVMLPGIDGFEVARTLRADQALKDVLLVALTGYALQEDLEKASAAGFAKHLTKPPNIEKLQELLGAS